MKCYQISNKDVSKKDQLRKINSISNLDRPESVSRLDDLLVTCNSGNGTISIYQITENNNFELKQLITGDGDELEYVHDAQITDRFILAAGRNKHCIIIYIKENGSYVKHIEIKGKKTLLKFPAGVSISPDERYVTVANRASGITVYKIDLNQPGIYSGKPFLSIPLSFYIKLKLSPPHNIVNLSNNKIASVHKSWGSSDYPNGVTIFNIPEKRSPKIGDLFSHVYYFDNSVSTCCHSIDYDSITKSIYFIEEHNGIFIMEETDNNGYKFSNIPSDEEGCLKGIDISKDGKTILVSGEFNRIDMLQLLPN